MSVVIRGVKNAFRNRVRTGAVVFILAIGIGLSLSMLVANQAVEGRITDLKAQMGTTLTVNPAGSQGFEGGGEPLTNDDVSKVTSVAHVSQVDATLRLRLRNENSQTGGMLFGPGGGQDTNDQAKTSLTSPIEPGTLGRRSQGTTTTELPATFSLPITATGISGDTDAAGNDIKIIDGRALNSDDAGKNNALVGATLATKNNLSVGSTFTAYGQTITVVGIFDQGTTFDNAGFYLPLSTAQALSGQNNEVSSIVAHADSIENLESAKTAIQTTLGSSKADVTSSQQNVDTAIASLQSVQKVSIVGFVAALIAAGVIIFMIMLVVVRERRREIGVLKAIGASNLTIVKQFMVEAMVLVSMGALVGVGVAFASSGGIANALVSSNTGSESSQTLEAGPQQQGGRGMIRMSGGPGAVFGGENVKSTTELVGTVTASVGIGTLLYGLLAALGIGLIGSAIPAWFIAKIRPVEVMRGE